MTSKRILQVFGLSILVLIGVIDFNTVKAMEDVLVMIAIGLALSGMWIMVRDIRRTEEESQCHHRSEPNHRYLTGDEGRHDGSNTIDTSEWSNSDWLELLDLG